MTLVVRAFAPASVSNVACGFDALGFAIEHLGDVVVATETDGKDLFIGSIRGDHGRLPTDAAHNTAALAAAAVHAEAARRESEVRDWGVRLDLEKHMPLSSGLGSSAASAVAGAVAVAALVERRFGLRFSQDELLGFALAGEQYASGALHGDNVAPSLFGGFVLVRALTPQPDIVVLPECAWLHCALVLPQLSIDTYTSRMLIPREIPLAVAVRQWANVGALVAALAQHDAALLGRALEDHVAEPARKETVPGFDAAMQAARAAGALGGSLSGSGPALFALCEGRSIAERAALAMAAALKEVAGTPSRTLVSTVGAPGARLLADSSDSFAATLFGPMAGKT